MAMQNSAAQSTTVETLEARSPHISLANERSAQVPSPANALQDRLHDWVLADQPSDKYPGAVRIALPLVASAALWAVIFFVIL